MSEIVVEKRKRFNESHSLLANQVEIFVPKDPGKTGKLRLWFDNFMMQPTVPIRRYSSGKDLYLEERFPDKEYWENIIYGYSIYNVEGHFIASNRKVRDYFPEDTTVIKLILTNYVTNNLGHPEITKMAYPQDDPDYHINCVVDCFNTNEVSSNIAELYDEYCMVFKHLDETCHYIIEGLSNEVMNGEHQIWMQSWITSLSVRFKKSELEEEKESSRPPIVLTEGERRNRYDHLAEKVICVFDYVYGGEKNDMIAWYRNDFKWPSWDDLPSGDYSQS